MGPMTSLMKYQKNILFFLDLRWYHCLSKCGLLGLSCQLLFE